MSGRVMASFEKHRISFERKVYADGINIIGPLKSEIGLGQSCRLVVHEAEHSGLPFTAYNYNPFSKVRSEDSSCDSLISRSIIYNINILHINPYELPFAYINLGNGVWDKRYNIAFWLWELETFPAEWITSLKLVDEIWTPSAFASEAIRKVTRKPVVTIPYGLTMPICGEFNREYFGLPACCCLFLCMYDSSSTIERKNPLGAIRAFKRAFEKNDNTVLLVIKMNNPIKKDLSIISDELGDYSNVTILADTLMKNEINSLIKCCDVLVSLHRAEGFGLVPAEAMFLETAVIATNWSSTTEFMTQDTACLVDFEFKKISESTGPYKRGWRWAEPDIDQAAYYMRRLYTDETFRTDLTNRAKKYIEMVLDLDIASKRMASRIKQIYCEQDV